MNKKYIIIAAAIALVVMLLGGGLWAWQKGLLWQSKKANKDFSIKQTQLYDFDKYFPKDLPIQSGSELIQSYEAVNADGVIQATIMLSTEKALSVAVNDYARFFENNGWTDITGPSANISGDAVSMMKKADESLTIIGRTQTENQRKTIEITLVKPPKL